MDSSRVPVIFGISIILSIQNAYGMFEAILTQIDVLFINSPYADVNLKVIRFNRTTFVANGSFELYLDSIDDVDILCSLYKKGGNEYKLTPYKVGPDNFCKAILDEKLFYPHFHTFTENFPPLGTCDFKRGMKYGIKNYLPELDKVPPVFQSGDYLAECKFFRQEEFIQGFSIYSQIYNIPGGNQFG